MERFNKKIIFIIMMIGVFLLTGCDKFHFNNFTDNQSTEKVSAGSDNNQKNTKKQNSKADSKDVSSQKSNTSSNSPANSIQPVSNVQVPIYTVNADSGQVESATTLISKGDKLTPKIIVNKVAEALADQNIIIGIDSVTTDGDTVIVSFYHNKPPVINVSGDYEASILDAIAQSLIDNLDNYNKVIYRVEGKAYKSDYFEFSINEVYFKR